MLGRYELLGRIAQGGVGSVYLARVRGAGQFERLSALKLLHPHLARDGEFTAMLLDEARMTAGLRHPHVVSVEDVGTGPLGHHLAMQYVDGLPLGRVLSGLDPDTAIRVGLRSLEDAAAGLHAAHVAKDLGGRWLGIVHRDVSPANILVGREGVSRVVDFGIALAASRLAVTRPEVLKGKPRFMAPEQVLGLPCDARTDVFALSVLLFELLTGRRLYEARGTAAILARAATHEGFEGPGVLPARWRHFAPVLEAGLAREPASRFPTARLFAEALHCTAQNEVATYIDVAEAIESAFGAALEARDTWVAERASGRSTRELGPADLHTIPDMPSPRPPARTSPGPIEGLSAR